VSWSPVVELRQYALHPGARDVLIELFDTHFLESQEELGMKIIGQFRDLDDPDRFTWLRGFPSMAERPGPLQAFYTGPVWKAHASAANATMIDSDNVLLLRPLHAGSTFRLPDRRPAPGATTRGRALVEAVVVSLARGVTPAEATSFERDAAMAAGEAGGSLLASFITEEAENNFPALPVREGERVLVWFLGFADRDRHDTAGLDRIAADVRGPGGPPLHLRLAPTSRSHLGDEAILLSRSASST
jgi:NIPSNAP